MRFFAKNERSNHCRLTFDYQFIVRFDCFTVAAVGVRYDNERLEFGFGGSRMLQVDKIAERCEDECCTPPALILSSKPTVDRRPLVREAFRLEWITIGWMVIEAVAAIGSGIVSGSLVLLAFGLDSLIELISAGVLMWRLSVELRHGHAFSENAERIAGRIGGALLFALAAYVVVAAAWNLWTQHHGDFSAPGFIVTLLAIVGFTQMLHHQKVWPGPHADVRFCSFGVRDAAVEASTR